MLLLGALFALLTVGFWVRCARRPRHLARPAGSAAEDAFRRHPAGRALSTDPISSDPTSTDLLGTDLLGTDLESVISRSPYAQARPHGPDDDPEFLRELDRLIRRRPDDDT
jgi:hypothetical protein